MLAIRTVIGASLVFAMTSFGIAACSSDDTKPPPAEEEPEPNFCDLPPVCQDIMAACHPKDLAEEGSDIHDCHEVAHDDGTEAGCEAAHDRCVKLCNDAPLPPNGEPYVPEDCSDGGHDH